MLTMVHFPVASPDPALPEVAVRVDRRMLAKRIWRGKAQDGAEFGFELETPLKPGAVIWQTATARYVIEQEPEPVLEVSLAIAPSAAAGIGWAVGNLHLELSADEQVIRAPDEPAARQLFARLQVPFTATTAVFRPGRFKRGALPVQELGPSHQH